MDHADDDDDGVFVYMGGNQRVPKHVIHVRVHKSVKIIIREAFIFCRNLVSIEMHDGVEIIERWAFRECVSLRQIKLAGVRVVEEYAFRNCKALAEVEFGNNLDTIGKSAFSGTALRNAKLPKVRVIGDMAFLECNQLMEVKLSKDLERIEDGAFYDCPRLRRIAMPLKTNLLYEDVFDECVNLSQVDLIGGIHRTVSSLLLQSWRNEMNNEIELINHILPNTDPEDKTDVIQDWLERVLLRINHYKSENYKLLKQFTTLLELALWKAKLDEMVNVKDNIEMQAANMVINDDNSARRELRVTSGANIVIKNVLPFLALE